MSINVETRLTYDHGGEVGVHCDYPLGLHRTIRGLNEKFGIDMGQYPIHLCLNGMPGWAILTDCTGVPMHKFRPPTEVTDDYMKHEWWYYDKKYVLEIRYTYMD